MKSAHASGIVRLEGRNHEFRPETVDAGNGHRRRHLAAVVPHGAPGVLFGRTEHPQHDIVSASKPSKRVGPRRPGRRTRFRPHGLPCRDGRIRRSRSVPAVFPAVAASVSDAEAPEAFPAGPDACGGRSRTIRSVISSRSVRRHSGRSIGSASDRSRRNAVRTDGRIPGNARRRVPAPPDRAATERSGPVVR